MSRVGVRSELTWYFEYHRSAWDLIYLVAGYLRLRNSRSWHDLKHNQLSELSQTPLGLLAKAECVKILRKVNIDKYKVVGFQYPEDITPADDENSICCAHRYVDFCLDDFSLKSDEIPSLGYKCLILGHGHEPKDFMCGSCKVFNVGSLSRCTSDKYNRTRIPRVLEFDGARGSFKYVDVSCLPGEDIFVKEKDKPQYSMLDLINYIQSSSTSSTDDVWEYVNSMDIPPTSKNLIISYMKEVGV